MPTREGNIIRFDENDPADLAALIRAGLIWKGGPKAVSLALRALRSGAVPRPDNLPPEVEAWLDRTTAIGDTVVSEAGVTEDELAEAPPAVIEEEVEGAPASE